VRVERDPSIEEKSIKKVLEAKMRRRKRLTKKLDKIKNKSSTLAENDGDVNNRVLNAGLKKIQMDWNKTKRDAKGTRKGYTVVTKGKSQAVSGYSKKGTSRTKTKFVDARMKKDKRNGKKREGNEKAKGRGKTGMGGQKDWGNKGNKGNLLGLLLGSRGLGRENSLLDALKNEIGPIDVEDTNEELALVDHKKIEPVALQGQSEQSAHEDGEEMAHAVGEESHRKEAVQDHLDEALLGNNLAAVEQDVGQLGSQEEQHQALVAVVVHGAHQRDGSGDVVQGEHDTIAHGNVRDEQHGRQIGQHVGEGQQGHRGGQGVVPGLHERLGRQVPLLCKVHQRGRCRQATRGEERHVGSIGADARQVHSKDGESHQVDAELDDGRRLKQHT